MKPKILKGRHGPLAERRIEGHYIRHMGLAALHMRACESGSRPNPFDQAHNDYWMDLLGRLLSGETVKARQK
jgi:hypothetical protein